ncbi:hypothetical protein I4U23_026075 [Adineta vaga]|nr:hypothetical protein I4U23_026075 [Adineta vaga]
MEMYNDGLADNSAMISATNLSNKPPSLEQHPEIKQVRKRLLIFIGIDLVLCLVNFLFIIHSYAASESLESQSPNSSSQLALVIILLIYYGFGLLCVYRYYKTGILFFALLGIITLLLTSTIVIMLLLRIIHIATNKGFVNAGIIVAIIYVSICSFVLIFQLMIIFYCFKFYILLKRNKSLTIERI